MTYFLVVGDRRFPIKDVRRFGRADLPSESVMDRAHFELSVSNGAVYVRDLHSTRGTILDGQPVTAGHLTPLPPGGVLRVGQTEFSIERRPAFAVPRWLWLTGASVFVLFSLTTFRFSGVAEDGAVSASGLAILLGLLLLSALVGLTLSVPLFGRARFSKALLVLGFGFNFLVTGLVDTGLILAAESQWRISETWRTARIESACMTKFEPSACARRLHACPMCVKRLDYGAREEIKFNLEPYRLHPRIAGDVR